MSAAVLDRCLSCGAYMYLSDALRLSVPAPPGGIKCFACEGSGRMVELAGRAARAGGGLAPRRGRGECRACCGAGMLLCKRCSGSGFIKGGIRGVGGLGSSNPNDSSAGRSDGGTGGSSDGSSE